VQTEIEQEHISLDKLVAATAVKKTQQNLTELYTDAAQHKKDLDDLLN